MAKVKKSKDVENVENVEKEKVSKITFESQLTKEYGKEILISAESLKDNPASIIPSTLSLDIALSGGIPEGTIVNIAGISLAGKTTLALTILANAQKMGKDVYYIDVENRLQLNLIQCIPGLDPKKLQIIRSSEDKFLTAENILNILNLIFKEKRGCVVVLDSVAALCSEGLLGIQLGESKRMADIPTLMYGFLRQTNSILAPTRSNLITITHMQANPGGYTGPVEVGGNAITYWSSIRLRCLSSQPNPKDGTPIGRISTFKVLKSALGPPSEGKFFIRYGSGYDWPEDLFSVGEELGLVEKSGSWYKIVLDDYEGEKYQGGPAFCAALRAEPEVAKRLETAIRQKAFGKV